MINPVKIDGMRSNFHDNMSDTVFEHICQYSLEIRRFGGCHRTAKCLAAVSIIQSPDDPDVETGL